MVRPPPTPQLSLSPHPSPPSEGSRPWKVGNSLAQLCPQMLTVVGERKGELTPPREAPGGRC